MRKKTTTQTPASKPCPCVQVPTTRSCGGTTGSVSKGFCRLHDPTPFSVPLHLSGLPQQAELLTWLRKEQCGQVLRKRLKGWRSAQVLHLQEGHETLEAQEGSALHGVHSARGGETTPCFSDRAPESSALAGRSGKPGVGENEPFSRQSNRKGQASACTADLCRPCPAPPPDPGGPDFGVNISLLFFPGLPPTCASPQRRAWWPWVRAL